MKILLIEDNVGDARLIEEYLKEVIPDFKLALATRLSAARETLASSSDFEVILLDLALPDSFGLETLDQIIALSSKLMPIIVLTGNSDKALAIEAVRKGAQDFITKGQYTPESLGKAIHYAVERKHTETTIMEQQRALLHASKLTAMGELTAFVFHEILNPLGVISMSAERLALQIGSNDSDKNARFVATISRNVDRITKITNGLKRFVKGSAHEPFEEIPLPQILSGVIELCEDRFRANGIPFEIARPNGLVKLQCREVEIAQVLVNLLNNAFDAVKNLPERWVRLEISDQERFVQFSVKDSGAGVPHDLVDKILETFFTTKASDGGTGLGLSISKRIVDEHNGLLEIDRNSPHTHFVVKLPKNPSQNLFQHQKAEKMTSVLQEKSAH